MRRYLWFRNTGRTVRQVQGWTLKLKVGRWQKFRIYANQPTEMMLETFYSWELTMIHVHCRL